MKVATAKRIDLEGRIEHEERKLNGIQDPTYSDDQRNMIEDRIKKLRDELNERNKEINILKDEASEQINQIRGSITKFLDQETGTLGERIRTLFKEQGIMVSYINSCWYGYRSFNRIFVKRPYSVYYYYHIG